MSCRSLDSIRTKMAAKVYKSIDLQDFRLNNLCNEKQIKEKHPESEAYKNRTTD